LSVAYPEYPWRQWHFVNVHQYQGQKAKTYSLTAAEFVQTLQLNMKSKAQFNSRQYANLEDEKERIKMLQEIFTIDNPTAIRATSKAQLYLFKMVQRLFPGHEVKINFKNPRLLYSKMARAMELDIYVPSLSLAFEYQGEQHYNPLDVS
jgi:hypothetical protein